MKILIGLFLVATAVAYPLSESKDPKIQESPLVISDYSSVAKSEEVHSDPKPVVPLTQQDASSENSSSGSSEESLEKLPEEEKKPELPKIEEKPQSDPIPSQDVHEHVHEHVAHDEKPLEEKPLLEQEKPAVLPIEPLKKEEIKPAEPLKEEKKEPEAQASEAIPTLKKLDSETPEIKAPLEPVVPKLEEKITEPVKTEETVKTSLPVELPAEHLPQEKPLALPAQSELKPESDQPSLPATEIKVEQAPLPSEQKIEAIPAAEENIPEIKAAEEKKETLPAAEPILETLPVAAPEIKSEQLEDKKKAKSEEEKPVQPLLVAEEKIPEQKPIIIVEKPVEKKIAEGKSSEQLPEKAAEAPKLEELPKPEVAKPSEAKLEEPKPILEEKKEEKPLESAPAPTPSS